MKNFLMCFYALFLSITATGAFAQDTLRLFHNSTSPERWEETRAIWQREGIIDGERITVSRIHAIAQEVSAEEKHPAAELSNQDFAALMAARNPGLPTTGTINEQTLRFMAQGGGIYLPTPAAVAAVRQRTEVPATSVASATASVPTLPAAVGTNQAVAIANLESQVKALQAALARSGATGKQVTTLASRLTALAQELNVLKAGQSGFAQKADLDAANTALTTLQGEVNNLAGLRDGMTRLEERVGGFEGRLSNIEGNPILAMGNLLFAALGLILLGSGIFAFVWRWRTNVNVELVKKGLVDVEKIAAAARDTANKADKQSVAAVTKVTAVESEVKKLAGRREVTFPLDFDAKVDGLTEAGQKCHFTVIVGDEHECHLTISLRSDNLYDILGIEDLTTGVSRKGLKKTIGSAATIIDGKSRLVGVAPDSVDSIQPAPEAAVEAEIPAFLRK